MPNRGYKIPPERQRQFDVIEVARKTLLEWTRSENIPLEHVGFVVPFVSTDFRLKSVFFYSTRVNVVNNDEDGTSKRLFQKFKNILEEARYPSEWLELVSSEFAAKEEVDELYEGRYDFYMR